MVQLVLCTLVQLTRVKTVRLIFVYILDPGHFPHSAVSLLTAGSFPADRKYKYFFRREGEFGNLTGVRRKQLSRISQIKMVYPNHPAVKLKS